MNKRTDPIPADEVGAELAVTRPAFPELAGWSATSDLPLAVAYGLSNERLAAIAAELGRQLRVTHAVRLMVGAALHKRRADYARGEWTAYVTEMADSIGMRTETVGKWMAAAERHYGLELPKGANPTRRKPVTRTDASSAIDAEARPPPVSGPDAARSSEVPKPEDPHVEFGRVAEEHPPTRKETAAGLQVDAPPATPVAPPEPPDDRASAYASGLLLLQPVELAQWALNNRTQAVAVGSAVTRALADTAAKARKGPAVSLNGTSGCPHPHGKRGDLGYAVRCLVCGTTKPTGAALDGDGAK